jgi:peptidoglycan/xylan/chitin deacetylase (PgdA/CDA1 family)
MLRNLKIGALRVLHGCGVFSLVAGSKWRRQRLLILCYHGTALEDEHLWRPGLYMPPDILEKRLVLLKKQNYSVIGLNEGLQALREGTLPPRSVVITFDDGTHDFYRQAYPRLKSFGFPVTVYQTSYYTDHPRPVFNLICSYMLWKRRGDVLPAQPRLGLQQDLDLRTESGRHSVVRALIDHSDGQNMNGTEKDQLAAQLAKVLRVDYEALRQKRILQLMNVAEVKEIAAAGVDIQLHTHRHRTPEDERLFRREIQDNRVRLRDWTGVEARHFCYPSGVYREQFFPWLQQENVISATTCDAGLATASSNALLLPRFVDSQNRSEIDFESWLSGVGDLLAFRRAAPQKYTPREH